MDEESSFIQSRFRSATYRHKSRYAVVQSVFILTFLSNIIILPRLILILLNSNFRRSESARDFGRQFVLTKETKKPCQKETADLDGDKREKKQEYESRLVKRKTWTKSLRVINGELDDNDVVEERIKFENNILDTEGYIVESVIDDPKPIGNKKGVIPAYDVLSRDFLLGVDKVYHFILIGDDIEVITTIPEYNQNKVTGTKAILSTCEKDEVYSMHGKSLKSKKPKVTKKERKFLSYVTDISRKNIRKLKSDQEILNGFLTLAKLDQSYLHADKSFKIGVICWKGKESDLYNMTMNDCSDHFKSFLSLLGDQIILQGWSGYSGGLDVHKGKDGKQSVFSQWRGNEIMFHVAPLMESSGHQRKVHIGNNTVVIVFIDSDQPFSPQLIHTKFNQVFIIIQIETDDKVIQRMRKSRSKSNKKRNSKTKSSKLSSVKPGLEDSFSSMDSESSLHRSSDKLIQKRGSVYSLDLKKKPRTYYKVCVLRREGVPPFSPKLPWPTSVFKKGKNFRTWLLEKATSANIASYQSDIFIQRLTSNRKAFLNNFVNKM